MYTEGSMAASMWIKQHPSAPNAVAMASRGWNRCTTQRRISSGERSCKNAFAAAISWVESVCVAIGPPSVPELPSLPGKPPWGLYHLYQHNKHFVKPQRET